MLLVLDGMRRDYFDRHAASMPTLTALRRQSAWCAQAQVNVLPSNTGRRALDDRDGNRSGVQGITGVARTTGGPPDARHVRRVHPQDLLALTLADVWQRATAGRAVILAREASTERDAARGAWRVSASWNTGDTREL